MRNGHCLSIIIIIIIVRSSHLSELIVFNWRLSDCKSLQISRILLIRSILNLLHNSQWITLPTRSCLVLYSFCASLLRLLIMWLMVSSLSPHNLHLVFCCVVYFCFDIVLMVLFRAAIGIDSVSLLRFPFLGHIQIFSCEISLVYPLKCSFIFCFLVIFMLMLVLSILFLLAVNSLPLRIFMLSSSHCIDASTLTWIMASLLLFLTHTVCLSHLWVVRPYA